MTGSAAALEEITQSYLDLRWHLDPVEATSVGISEQDHRLGSFTAEDVDEHLAALQSVTNALEELEVDTLDHEIDRTALLNEIRMTVQRFAVERPHQRNPNFWVSHVLEGLYLLLARDDRPYDHRCKAAAGRLELIPPFLTRAEETLAECPVVFAETAQQVVDGGLALVRQVAEELPTDDPAFAQSVEDAANALTAFAVFVESDARDEDADFAVGTDAFNYRLQFEHAFQATAPEIRRFGEQLVASVQEELAVLAAEIDPTAPWQDVMHRLRDEHPSATDLVAGYAAEMERAREFVASRGLAAIPVGELQVVETPPFLAPLIPFAAYQPPGPFSPDRRGLFYVSRPDAAMDTDEQDRRLRDHCYHELASTALHEGYPGHHLQFLAAQANESTVRKVLGTPSNYEGWALYCEEMMGDEGFYRTAEERFFQRIALLWRAARVVLDVGLHTRGMAIGDAVAMLIDLVAFDRASAEAEVRRYCETPCYQLSYAMGWRELKALRDDFERASGPDYTHRAFHDRVLSYGGLPVSLMRWGMGL